MTELGRVGACVWREPWGDDAGALRHTEKDKAGRISRVVLSSDFQT